MQRYSFVIMKNGEENLENPEEKIGMHYYFRFAVMYMTHFHAQ